MTAISSHVVATDGLKIPNNSGKRVATFSVTGMRLPFVYIATPLGFRQAG